MTETLPVSLTFVSKCGRGLDDSTPRRKLDVIRRTTSLSGATMVEEQTGGEND